ncbi:MAG: hypothetical protein JST78_06320 [Bacteroidetes bacterium]|nr:hypothetical protein [Bacteroidota bacterium]
MKTLRKLGLYFFFPAALITFSIAIFSCSKDKDDNDSQAYVCATCNDTPDALPANDSSIKGVYKGIVVGSTGTLSVNIQNGSDTITATMVLDGVSVLLTSNVSVVEGQTYIAPFTGIYNGNPISITFSVGLGGQTPTVVTSDIPGHPNAVFEIYKETSTSLIEAFQGTYSKTGETGVFNIVLSRALSRWGGVAKENGGTETNEVEGTIVSGNQLLNENGTHIADINGDVISGSFTDSNQDVVTVQGNRTL